MRVNCILHSAALMKCAIATLLQLAFVSPQPAQADTLLGIPTLSFTAAASENASFAFTNLVSVAVDARYQDAVDNNGETLIPPTLLEFARTFSEDLASIGVHAPVVTAAGPGNNSVFLTLEEEEDVAGKFVTAAGNVTSEGYRLEVTSDGIVVSGASPLGTWWGTRTVLQQAVLGGEIPLGSAVDSPGWPIRGAMLDIGRHYYPPSFLKELCSYLSFFKQNTFHVHLSDNLYANPAYSSSQLQDLYAAFRLNSPAEAVDGLAKPFRANESYTEDVFDDFQRSCAARGVTVVPELEAPGHALVIAQWKPELALENPSLLNISNPDTIPTVEAIWSTFLPWFHTKTVHIGADEYDATLADDYNLFVNTLSTFIRSVSNKSIRIWGTHEPGTHSAVSTNVTIQHWTFSEDNPLFSLLDAGYTVLNSDDSFYVVAKWSGSYPQSLNLTRTFDGNPAGGAWAPFVFDVKNATNNPPRTHPRVLGHVAALWNDYGPNATTYTEAYYAWREGMPALADKQWGGNLTLAEYEAVFETLHRAIPGQNLDRAIPSVADTILEYTFSDVPENGTVVDTSGNGYHGVCSACVFESGYITLAANSSLTTPLSSKGRDYTLSFRINPSSAAPIGSPVFTGGDSALLLGNGTVPNVALVSGNNPYMLNYTLPRDAWTDVSLVGRGNRTFLVVDEGEEMEFLARLGVNGVRFVWAPIAIEAPLKRIGGEGFVGSVGAVTLRGSA